MQMTLDNWNGKHRSPLYIFTIILLEMKHTETRARQTGPAVLLHQTQIGRSTTELLAPAPTLFSLTTCSTCNTDTHFYNSIGNGLSFFEVVTPVPIVHPIPPYLLFHHSHRFAPNQSRKLHSDRHLTKQRIAPLRRQINLRSASWYWNRDQGEQCCLPLQPMSLSCFKYCSQSQVL